LDSLSVKQKRAFPEHDWRREVSSGNRMLDPTPADW